MDHTRHWDLVLGSKAACDIEEGTPLSIKLLETQADAEIYKPWGFLYESGDLFSRNEPHMTAYLVSYEVDFFEENFCLKEALSDV